MFMVRRIREYVPEDLPDVLAAWESASRVAHPFLTKAFLEQERYDIPNVYLPNAETWVAEQEGKVVGFIALLGEEVGAIFVDPSCQGTGVGRDLMDKAQALRGDLEVEVFEANAIGRRFYDRYGFMPVGQSIHEQTGQSLLRLKFTAKSPASTGS